MKNAIKLGIAGLLFLSTACTTVTRPAARPAIEHPTAEVTVEWNDNRERSSDYAAPAQSYATSTVGTRGAR